MATATLREPTRAPITVDDFYEVVKGKRVRKPPRAVYSVLLGNTLYMHLACYVLTHGLGRTLQEALFHLPTVERDRRPDVAFVSYQRWAKTRPISRTVDAWDVVPNLAVEVISPTNQAEDLIGKIDEYFGAGVELVWVVYPQHNRVHVYQSPTRITGLNMADVLEGGDVVPGFRLPLAELFCEPAEEEAAP